MIHQPKSNHYYYTAGAQLANGRDLPILVRGIGLCRINHRFLP